MENVTSSWWTKLTFSSIKENSWSFSSHVPSPSFLEEDHLKFVEEQRWFLRHCWPHHIKLVESNRLKAYSRSCLLSHCLNCVERDDVESKLSLVAEIDGVWINNNKSVVFHRAICNQRTLSVLMDFRLQGRESDSFFFTICDRLNALLEVSEPKFSGCLLKY